MAIPESQLEIWAKQGAAVTAKSTHESIRNALNHERSPITNLLSANKAEIYLQGSYKNDTNVRADSDVDVVVELNNAFGHNAHELPIEQKQAHDQSYSNAKYDWAEFRADVIIALTRYYGAASIDVSGKKSLKLLPKPGRLRADIVPVIRYRNYSHFHHLGDYRAERGIKLYHQGTGKAIINYPHHHYNNGTAKNSENRTGGWFKPTVRIFKNMRGYLVEKGQLDKEAAPSYFLQSLIYNVPDEYFGESYQKTIHDILYYLYNTPIADFVCQNEQHLLFGETEEQWNEDSATETILQMVELWDNWNNL